MKCAKERLSNKTRADWEALQRLMSCGGSYKHYRAALAEVRRRPPFIPYLGVHLTDLVMLGEVLKLEGGPSKAEGKVNLTKRQQVHASIALCLAGRGARYGFAALPGIARMVEGASHMSEEQLYDASLAREPRGSCSTSRRSTPSARRRARPRRRGRRGRRRRGRRRGRRRREDTFMCPS